MSKSRYRPEHQRMLNDRRWMDTKRIVWQRANGLCEQCKAEGYVTAGVDCHHIIPFESGKTIQECERLCYDPNNCRLLCVPCHRKEHDMKGYHKRENVEARREQRMTRWKERISRMGTSNDNKT